MRLLLLFLLLSIEISAQPVSKAELGRWEQQAKSVTIIRDNWGIPHIYGKTDADAVFGLMYAQCEDDFKRIESNYIDILGRTAELKGVGSIYDDLYTRLVIDSAGAIKDYAKSPAWLKKLLHAWADAMNYYLYKHPEEKPALLRRFEPWYPLMWTDGSIAAINTGGLSANELKTFYTVDLSVAARTSRRGEEINSGSNGLSLRQTLVTQSSEVLRSGSDALALTPAPSAELRSNLNRFAIAPARTVQSAEEIHSGSNGFAVAPARTASGKPLLYINPHVTFYFRPEVHMVSLEGLNAYGAVTWGQFFVYQGFNEHCGWMHTSGYADVADLYAEQIVKQGAGYFYKYDGKLLPVQQHTYTLSYKDGDKMGRQSITTYATHHGPVMSKRDGKWVSVKAVNRHINGLIQAWQRTKSTNFASFKKNMQLLANASNNTVYADDQGNIAYWHGNFIPRRDTQFDWSKPVDGSIKATEWKGLHPLDETIHLFNPASGWIQNCNSTPFTSSGSSSPKKIDYPSYMSTEAENFRGINAVKVMARDSSFTIDKLIAAGYDTYLAFFEDLIPALVKAYATMPDTDPRRNLLIEAIPTLRNWDMRSNERSEATTLAIEWAQRLQSLINRVNAPDFVSRTALFAKTASAETLLESFAETVRDLNKRFGTWVTPWGTINRYQRLTGALQETYDDSKPSIPSGMAASTWGCLPSFVSRTMPGTQKRYGYNGNSFICAVEFGKTIKAKSLLAGGNSSHSNSPHFSDQAEMYTKGQFKDVLFYKEDVLKHAERTYHPGE
ncbi:penicillin acylase family protein [Paraflavitalea sp. CAU 1676]|uniref:penicillin acylase family protein n=1 Tax=Paraflavitalea sp. CAU 1676 TaxID=3032598 RepID=UPI0023DC14D6|nr:penicillin acylase family protein [Paraflavitalea sp. CAU 1676]MDF2190921.1 penicillin acylase family protein [Paraflavitalea sp. CAU 1676]